MSISPASEYLISRVSRNIDVELSQADEGCVGFLLTISPMRRCEVGLLLLTAARRLACIENQYFACMWAFWRPELTA